MALTLVLHAHPYPGRSRGCAALVSAVRDVPGVDVRTLYELYPDFDIDVAVELQALRAADRVVWLAPLYW
jgi:glutathione-regulated potassium-efflux system ancillary protein KefF